MRKHKKSIFMPRNGIRLLLLTVCVAGLSAVRASGQAVSLQAKEVTAQQAIEQIESQAGLIVGVNHRNFDTSRSITVSSLNVQAEDLLRQMVSSTGHTYIRKGRHVIIVKAEAPKIVERLDGQPMGVPQSERIAARTVQRPAPVEVVYTDIYHKDDKVYAVTADGPVVFERVGGQQPGFALKTNLLYGAATLTPNIGVEIGIGRKTTLEIAGGWNPWKLKGSFGDNKKLVHRYIRPEFRWWTCERFNGHFFGIHAIGANFNVSQYDIPFLDFKKEYRYQGNALGGGLTYGYSLMISPVVSLEFSIGAGVLWLDYDRYDCEKCAEEKQSFTKTRFAPTKAGISLVFILK